MSLADRRDIQYMEDTRDMRIYVCGLCAEPEPEPEPELEHGETYDGDGDGWDDES